MPVVYPQAGLQRIVIRIGRRLLLVDIFGAVGIAESVRDCQ